MAAIYNVGPRHHADVLRALVSSTCTRHTFQPCETERGNLTNFCTAAFLVQAAFVPHSFFASHAASSFGSLELFRLPELHLPTGLIFEE